MQGSANPNIIAVQYDGALTVSAQWTPSAGGPNYVVAVLDGTTVIASSNVLGLQGKVTLKQALPPGSSYTVAAAASGTPTQWGTSMIILAGKLTDLSAAYEGGLELATSWKLPPDGLSNGAEVTVLDTGKQTVVTTANLLDTSGTVPLPSRLDPLGSYTLQGSAEVATSTGPPITIELVTTAPALTALEYDATARTVEVVLKGTPPPNCVPAAQLLGDGKQVTSKTGSPGVKVTLQPDAPLDPTVAYVVRPYWVNGTARGPYGAPVDVPVARPTIRAVRWEGDKLVLDWENQPGPPYPTGAQIEVTAPGEATRGSVSPNATHHAFAPNPALLPGSTYTATVAAVRGAAQGPSGPGVPVVSGKTALTRASYDGRTVTAKWTDGAPAGASECELLVSQGGAVVARGASSGGAAAVPVTLDPALAYTAALHWNASGTNRGPAGPATALIAGAPVLTAAAATDKSVALTWQAPPDPGSVITGYEAVFTGRGRSETVALGPTSPKTIDIPSDLDALTPVEVAVRATGATATGPAGAGTPVLRAAPATVEASLGASALTVTWTAVLDAAEGYAVTLTIDGTPTTTYHRGERATLPVTGSLSGKTCTVAVRAGRGVSAGPSLSLPLVVDPPKMTTLVRDGAALTATWTAPSLPAKIDEYVVTVRDGSVVVARAVVSGTTATVALPPVAAGARTVTVAGRAGGSLGPETAGVPVPAVGPALSNVAVAPITHKATVGWVAAGGTTTGYLVQAYRNGRPDGEPVTAGASDTTAVLTTDPVAYEDLEVALAVKATEAAGAVATTTAFGPRLRVPTEPPVIRDVDFDGASVRVTWDPVPGVIGYSLSALAAGLDREIGHTDVVGQRTSARFKVTLDSDLTRPYQVAVEPVTTAGHGVGAYAPLFATGLYVRPATAATTNPVAPALPARIVRATTPALAPSAVTAYLPNLGPLTGLPIKPPQSGASDFPFTLDAVSGQSPPLKYKLTIDNGALRFDSGRATLAATYGQLLTTAETNGATPRGILAIQEAIARLMPQTFEETLFYSYGITAANPWVDLRPGMVLRVAFSSFDLTAVSGAEKWSTGYTGGSVVDYDVGDLVAGSGLTSSWLVGFDAFVDWLVANEALTVPAPQQEPPQPRAVDVVETGGADAADLSFPGFQQPFYRLLVPGALQGATAAAKSRTGQQFTIAAAAKWQQINQATTLPGGGVNLAYFRGRTVVRPCIRVEVDGVERTVPIGTTVGNVLDQLARRPPSAPVPLLGVRLERAPGPAVLDPKASYRADALARVHLDWNGIVTWTTDPRDALSLPLLHGDRISFGETA